MCQNQIDCARNKIECAYDIPFRRIFCLSLSLSLGGFCQKKIQFSRPYMRCTQFMSAYMILISGIWLSIWMMCRTSIRVNSIFIHMQSLNAVFSLSCLVSIPPFYLSLLWIYLSLAIYAYTISHSGCTAVGLPIRQNSNVIALTASNCAQAKRFQCNSFLRFWFGQTNVKNTLQYLIRIFFRSFVRRPVKRWIIIGFVSAFVCVSLLQLQAACCSTHTPLPLHRSHSHDDTRSGKLHTVCPFNTNEWQLI